jgi:hypothetical protein
MFVDASCDKVEIVVVRIEVEIETVGMCVAANK